MVINPHAFVYSAVLLLVVASAAVAVFRHFGLGSILGLLVTGIIIGPYTPGPFITTEVESVRQFAEIGVVLLLFLIGLEIKPRHLWELRRMLFGLGSLQIILSALALAAYFRLFHPEWAWPMAAFVGAGFALSSTAIVVQILRDQGEIASPHGQTAFAVLLMQDLAVVPLLALVPVMADSGPLPHGMSLWAKVATAAGIVALVVLAGRQLVPRILDYLARRNNREGFFLVTMGVVFAAALAMEQAGMSMALGAFLMGMMLSSSRYSLQIEATMEPHKGLMMSLFFVAVGMSVDVNVIIARPLEFTAHVVAVMGIKAVVLYGLCLLFRTGRRAALRVAFTLSQGGEFGFVVFGAARALGVIDDGVFVTTIGVISLTMLMTPLVLKVINKLAPADTICAGDGPGNDPVRYRETSAGQAIRAVIAGYGRVGHTVGTIFRASDIPYIAFDTDANLVAKWRAEGHPVFYGDICHQELIGTAAVQGAELIVLTIDDGHSAIRAATLIRSQLPEATIVARARDLVTCDALQLAGVTQAFPETLEASLRLASESLIALGIPVDQSDSLMRGVRQDDYKIVRSGPEAVPISQR